MTANKMTRLALVGMLAGALSAGTALAQAPAGGTTGGGSGSAPGSLQTPLPGGSTGQTAQPGTGSTTDDVQRDQGLTPPTDSLGTGGSGTGNLPQQGDALDPSRGTGINPNATGTPNTGDTTLNPGTTQPAPLTPDSNWSGTGGAGTQGSGMNTPGQGTLQTSPNDQSDLNTTPEGQVNPDTTNKQTR